MTLKAGHNVHVDDLPGSGSQGATRLSYKAHSIVVSSVLAREDVDATCARSRHSFG